MNRINHKGFTLTELLIVISIGIFLVLIVILNVLNTPRATQERATAAMRAWVAETGTSNVQRASCAHDNDGDGYASCTVVQTNGAAIELQCTSGFTSILPFYGVQTCKEIAGQLKLSR